MIMEIHEANYLKVKNNKDNKEYYLASQEHCDLWWNTNETVIAGDCVFYNYPDMHKVVFNIWETKEKVYFDVLEYSFDYGETWNKMN